MLLLKRHLVQLVREGKKRQTIRLWSRPLVRVGQLSFTPGLGRMRILSVDTVPSLDALTDQDAIADGFANRAALLAEIKKIYGPITRAARSKSPPRTLFRITFEWPIDAAGKSQILAPAALAPAPISPRKKTKSTATVHAPPPRVSTSRITRETIPRSPKRRPMSPAQRKTLRRFVLSNAPAS